MSPDSPGEVLRTPQRHQQRSRRANRENWEADSPSRYHKAPYNLRPARGFGSYDRGESEDHWRPRTPSPGQESHTTSPLHAPRRTRTPLTDQLNTPQRVQERSRHRARHSQDPESPSRPRKTPFGARRGLPQFPPTPTFPTRNRAAIPTIQSSQLLANLDKAAEKSRRLSEGQKRRWQKVREQRQAQQSGHLPTPPPTQNSGSQHQRRAGANEHPENQGSTGRPCEDLEEDIRPATGQQFGPHPPVNSRSTGQRRRWQRGAEQQAEQGLQERQRGSQSQGIPQLAPAEGYPNSAGLLSIARRPYRERGRQDFGRMDILCPFCSALHWEAEQLTKSTYERRLFGTCCNSGQVRLPPITEPPPALRSLYQNNDPVAKEFRENITQYNAAFGFTSLGIRPDDKVTNNRYGPSAWVLRIHGALHHLTAAFLRHPPGSGTAPSFSQIYAYDPTTALRQRMGNNSNLRRDTMQTLQGIINRHNPYARMYRHAYEVLDSHENAHDVSVRLTVSPGTDRRRYNLPTADEVAMILPGDGSGEVNGRDIILRARPGPEDDVSGNPLHRISDGHPAYDPLQYVLLFPHGDPGWSYEKTLYQPDKERPKKLSLTRYSAYRLFPRPNEFSTILHGERMEQYWTTDKYASADQDRLAYLKNNQPKLRADCYSGMQDEYRVQGDETDLATLGRMFILPASYIGGPRHMQQRYQDAMAIARYFHMVDLFITMTANPEWEEILRELMPGQTHYSRPDLVARVFEMKKKLLIEEIYKHGVFGKAAAYVYTIEFQKRGLPHIHLLVFLQQSYKLKTPEDIDSCISAEWPDPVTQPRLFETIRKCMVHGPCGSHNGVAPCMENGRCTKYYPKDFQEHTKMDEDGYPKYRRRDDGRKFQVGKYTDIDNRWIVPYSPYLSAKFHCHINVEGDRATAEIDKLDEIKQHIDGRYLGPPESIWRIFHFDVHTQVPNVVRLQVHLPGQHMVVFRPDDPPEVVMERASREKTTLTASFNANRDTGELGRLAMQCTYQEFPQSFVWKDDKKEWKLREKGFALGRMYFVSPNSGERFYLRLLLTVVKGATSFESLRTYRGVVHTTFREVCLARGLLEDDGEWHSCLEEASHMKSGYQLRMLFSTILHFCVPSEPEKLWLTFRESICDDLEHKLRLRGRYNISEDEVYDYGLFLINGILLESGRTLRDFPPMPLPTRDWSFEAENPLIAEQLDYDRDIQRERSEASISKFNPDQLGAFTSIRDSVENESGQTFFLNGPGGTGKTFVFRTLCQHLRGNGDIVLCCASSGIAALLYEGGRTAHSLFKIPIDVHGESTCNISKNSQRAGLVRALRLGIWDETFMQHRHTQEALDRTFRDLRGVDKPFGGCTMVFGGDSQQILPVVVKGSPEEIIDASLPRSYLWEDIEVLKLHKNERLESGSEQEAFANWLLNVGHGRNISDDGMISFPEDMRCYSEETLIDEVYPSIGGTTPPPQYFADRIILAARNNDVEGINKKILAQFSPEVEPATFNSVDTVISEPGADGDDLNNTIPPEYLRSLNSSGLPPGELSLKPGCPLILLRNLAPARGLCNGTRLLLLRASDRVLETQILGGDHDGEKAFIPRIDVTPSGKSSEFSFQLKRRQFPVRLAFAISINRAQGQSVVYVGIDARLPVFTHGQLYVALSRATSRYRVKVLLPHDATETRIKNIVYTQALLD